MKRAIVFVLAAVSLVVVGCSSASETDPVKPGAATTPPATAKPGSDTKPGTMVAKPLIDASEADKHVGGKVGGN